MGNLAIKTQNVKGGTPQFKDNVGYVSTFIGNNEDRIVVDAFEGFGETYKRREMHEISIFENGTLIFNGNKYELFEKLK